MKISELITKLNAFKKVHGDCEMNFDIPELNNYNAEFNIWADGCRATNHKTKFIHLELYTKKMPETEGEYMRKRNPPMQS